MQSKSFYIYKSLLVVGFYLLSLGICAQTKNYYVDVMKGRDTNTGTSINQPLKTIEFAKERIAKENKVQQKDIYVYIRQGVYQLANPVIFTTKDGGNNGHKIVYKSYKGENVIITGGVEVKKWRLFDKKKNIYLSRLPVGIDSRQLFVNGLRASRARSIGNEKRWIIADSIGHLTSDLSLLQWKNKKNIECVYREIWTNPRCGISSIEQFGDTLVRITMKQPGWSDCRNKGITSTRIPWYFENAYELLDEEGEWYLDKEGTVSDTPYALFYKPRFWENMDKEKVIIPTIEKLFIIRGDNAKTKVNNLFFEGLSFEYTTWLRPNTPSGHSDAQNNVLRENKSGHGEFIADGAAVSLKYAENITIKNCQFLHLGCAGINMGAGCSNNSIESSLFYDLSATAIQIGDYRDWKNRESENSYDPINVSCLLSGNKVINNHIEQCGVEYRSSTGIAAAFPVNSLFQGNTLRNLPYSGFHIGWGWTAVPYTVNTNNIIKENFIQNVMLELADGGAIYTLGSSIKEGRNKILGNRINRSMWGQGIYLDNGSAFYDVNNNVYEKVDDYNLKINSGSHDIIAQGIYSNKSKNLIGKGCYNYKVDSTRLFTSECTSDVERICERAGAKRSYSSVWQLFPDLNLFEAENAELNGHSYSTSGIGTNVYGYSGMGFLSGFNKGTNNSANFIVAVSEYGNYQIMVRYSAGKGWENKVWLDVNQNKLLPLKMNSSDPSQWNEVVQIATLHKGVNTITLKTVGENDQHLYFDVVYIIKNKK